MSIDTESHLFTSHHSYIFSHSTCIIFITHGTNTSLHSSSSFTHSNTVELCTQIITVLKYMILKICQCSYLYVHYITINALYKLKWGWQSSTQLQKYDTHRWHVYTDNPETYYWLCISLPTVKNEIWIDYSMNFSLKGSAM